MVLNKDGIPYKSMLREKSLARRGALFIRRDVWKVSTALSQLSATNFKRYRGSDKCEAVFWSIDRLPACFYVERYLCWKPNLPVATHFHGPWWSTRKLYESEVLDEGHCFFLNSCQTVRITNTLHSWWNTRFDRHSRALVYFRWERNGGKSVQNRNQTFGRTPSSSVSKPVRIRVFHHVSNRVFHNEWRVFAILTVWTEKGCV